MKTRFRSPHWIASILGYTLFGSPSTDEPADVRLSQSGGMSVTGQQPFTPGTQPVRVLLAAAVPAVITVDTMVLAKANPNAFDRMGFTPLINAASITRGIEMKNYQGSGPAIDKVRLLLERGAKPSLGAKGQMPRFTALHAAAGDLEVIRLLAAKGADLSATCGESISSPGITGKTPRELAEMSNQWAAAKLPRELDQADR